MIRTFKTAADLLLAASWPPVCAAVQPMDWTETSKSASILKTADVIHTPFGGHMVLDTIVLDQCKCPKCGCPMARIHFTDSVDSVVVCYTARVQLEESNTLV